MKLKFRGYDESNFLLAFSSLSDRLGVRGFFFEFFRFRADLYWRPFDITKCGDL